MLIEQELKVEWDAVKANEDLLCNEDTAIFWYNCTIFQQEIMLLHSLSRPCSLPKLPGRGLNYPRRACVELNRHLSTFRYFCAMYPPIRHISETLLNTFPTTLRIEKLSFYLKN